MTTGKTVLVTFYCLRCEETFSFLAAIGAKIDRQICPHLTFNGAETTERRP